MSILRRCNLHLGLLSNKLYLYLAQIYMLTTRFSKHKLPELLSLIISSCSRFSDCAKTHEVPEAIT
ncbi:hypothetical protein CW304_07395 [Bacillus sp. UFRGS-B20]|nr:hypothetical protein CW304_07395 [Bacillus sp. UFRGS-B20]